MPHAPLCHLPESDYPRNLWRGLKIIKPLVMEFSPDSRLSCYVSGHHYRGLLQTGTSACLVEFRVRIKGPCWNGMSFLSPPPGALETVSPHPPFGQYSFFCSPRPAKKRIMIQTLGKAVTVFLSGGGGAQTHVNVYHVTGVHDLNTTSTVIWL
jgi:hypothetical protein